MDRGSSILLMVALVLVVEIRNCSSISRETRHEKLNITTDQSALLALKSSFTFISGDHILMNNWSLSTSPCTSKWVGVVCTTRHQRVVALDLSNMGLSGTISPHIGNLSFLGFLSLKNNRFRGVIPEELSRLRRLKFIYLNHNNFTQELPLFFTKLPQLKSLLLSYNNFFGTISPRFFNMSKIEILSLGGNSLQGNIPHEISNLVSLTDISVEHNQLTGSIPLEIFNISTLRSVGFSDNRISGNFPLDLYCQLAPQIEKIYLSVNPLSGSIPSDLYECRNLQLLSVSRTGLSGTIPRHVGNLSALRELYLGFNSIQGEIPEEIGNLLGLVVLGLDSNILTGHIPESIFNLSKLQEVSFVANHLQGHLPSNFGQKQPNLKSIYFGGNSFTGNFPDSISNATQLVELDVGYNRFSGTIPKSIGSLRNLEYLNLEWNNFTTENGSSALSFIVTSLKHLRVLSVAGNSLDIDLSAPIGNFSTSLEIIYADECGITGTLPSSIGHLRSLTELSLVGNDLTGKIPKTIKGLSNLQMLDLTDNKLRGSIPDDFCLLLNLGSLRLQENQFSGPIPACLGDITSLRYVYLGSNRLTSTLPASIGKLKDLLNFSASSNFLSGPLPSELGKLNVVELIDLSDNQFSGDIPSVLGELQQLVTLSLGNNRLQGHIPNTFQYMTSLENLDLSHNKLSGEIPKSLEKLLHLKYFNVSSNSLSGEIPAGGPFKSFSSESFLWNQALCGASRFHVAQCPVISNHRHHGSRKKKVVVVVSITLSVVSILSTLILAFVLVRHRKRRRSVPSRTNLSPIAALERISYHELQRATDGFSATNMLGMGSFGSVYKGVLGNGVVVAIKVFNLKLESGFNSFDAECQVLRNLRHRNLRKVISSCSNLDFKALVLEYMPNGSLENLLYSDKHFLDVLPRIDIMIDVACALEYLHYGYSTPVVHCDLKPSNVLLDEDMVARVADFGIAKLLGDGESIAQTITLATIGYIAPEYGTEGLVSRKCDVYSYGIMLMEVFTRVKPSDDQVLGDLSLKKWVQNSFPESVIQVIDSSMLKEEDKNIKCRKIECVSSIIGLALGCSADSPEDRFNIKDVLATLRKIKLQFIGKA